MGRFRDEELGFQDDTPPDATLIPWIDIHQHGQTLSWKDREEFDLSGGLAVVMIAAAAHYAPYRPMQPSDVRFLWDDAIRRSHAISRSHFFDARVAVGVHTTRTRKQNYEELLEVLPAYADLDEVVAIGETGISVNTNQYADPWSVDEQRTVVAEQMRIAADAGLPFLCHTPTMSKGRETKWIRGKTEGGHDLPVPEDRTRSDRGLDPTTAKLDATKIDIELKDEVGLPDEQLVLDHAHPAMVPYVMDNTDCYVSFSVGQWVRETDATHVAETIEEYGPERVMIDTDAAGLYLSDAFAMKTTILDLLRLGIDVDDVRTVVYENPREVLGLSHLPA